MEEDSNEQQQPFYIELLKPEDRKTYDELRTTLSAPDHRYNRNKRIVTFTDMLDQIRDFCERGDGDDWKRYLVCGICWIKNDIAINTRQLRILLGKSKSTINGAFSKMNYETLPFRNHDSGLQDKIPFLRGNFTEARQWTVRRLSSLCISDSPAADTQIAPSSPEVPPKAPKRAPKQNKTAANEPLVFPEQEFSISFSMDNNDLPADYFDPLPFTYTDEFDVPNKQDFEALAFPSYMKDDVTFMY